MRLKAYIRSFFYGNYFYGFCAVALALESSIQQNLPLNSILYYLLLFCCTVLYYTHAYISEIKIQQPTTNERTIWYRQAGRFIVKSQIALTVISVILLLLMFNGLQPNLPQMPYWVWLICLVFGLLGAFYYGGIRPGKSKWVLRKNGLLKPLLIAWVWAGMVSFSPILFYDINHLSTHSLQPITWVLFFKNWIFISILCILFDIKDYATDFNLQLKTWVVQFGLRKTLFSILLPMATVGLGAYWWLAFSLHFSIYRIVFNSIPFVLLIIVAYSMHQRKSILYYLAIIDGLMLVKALCGIAGMIVF